MQIRLNKNLFNHINRGNTAVRAQSAADPVFFAFVSFRYQEQNNEDRIAQWHHKDDHNEDKGWAVRRYTSLPTAA